jgi:hypothetical protein
VWVRGGSILHGWKSSHLDGVMGMVPLLQIASVFLRRMPGRRDIIKIRTGVRQVRTYEPVHGPLCEGWAPFPLFVTTPESLMLIMVILPQWLLGARN